MSFQSWFELGCAVGVLIIGMATTVAVCSRLQAAAPPLVGLFLLAADSHLYCLQAIALCMVELLGYNDVIRNTHPWISIWYYTWRFLPVFLAALSGWMLVRGLRRSSVMPSMTGEVQP